MYFLLHLFTSCLFKERKSDMDLFLVISDCVLKKWLIAKIYFA